MHWLQPRDPGHVNHFRLAAQFGDAGDQPGTSPTDPNRHDTYAQRSQAFENGWSSIRNCGLPVTWNN
jgi:hypothetical protein